MTIISNLKTEILQSLVALSETPEYQTLQGVLQLMGAEQYELLMAPQGSEKDLANLNFVRGVAWTQQVLRGLNEVAKSVIEERGKTYEPSLERDFPHPKNIIEFKPPTTLNPTKK